MKALKYWVEYVAVVSLISLTISGIYDIIADVKATNWYLHWHEEHYGAMSFSSVVFTYALGQIRGISVTFGCGLVGIMQVCKKRVRIGYLLFLAFWTAQYVLVVVDKAYKGVKPSDAVQMVIALFCFASLILYKAVHPIPAPQEPGRLGR